MHEPVFRAVILWQVVLMLLLVFGALRARTVVVRALALDTLNLVLVASLAVIAIHREQPGFLDVALVLAMLGFTQTVATARISERRRDLE
jgi:multicomponent Na+:H+ antiporter subunit F